MTNNIINADFTSKNTFEEKANYSEIVFGVNKPLLTPELNELQSIIKSHRANIIDTLFGSGILGVGTITFGNGMLTIQNEKAIVKGELINITSQNIALSEGNDVYLTASYVEKTGSDTIKEYGNPQSSVNVTNRIEDENYGETSRRKQLVFSLSKVSVPNGLNLKLGRISGGKFIQECKTVSENLVSNVMASNISIQDAENLFNAKNVEDALIELMRATKTMYKTVEGSFITENNTLDGFAKNVEIKGNTVQNPSNLADIKSVGNLREDGLYEIPILCTGKNLFNEKLEKGTIDNNGNLVSNNNHQRPIDFTPVPKIFSLSKKTNGYLCLICYDKSKEFIGKIDLGTGLFWSPVPDIPQNTRYVKFRYESLDNPQIQIEYGTQSTSFEPYQEHKMTILSPVQLEKVGDVEDGIIEKDGVWGVEKNNNKAIFTGKNVNGWNNDRKFLEVTVDDILPQKQLFSDKYSFTDNVVLNIGIGYVGHNAFRVKPNNYESITTKEQAIEEMNKNPLLVYYPLKVPKFIPLPDDQQVKLRTFANQTNISFLTEIEGTIKADVPKSLGASVSSNTKAIQDLNKDLEKVKKLEEATTTLVTTESNFVTVEETNNGYFGDIKLEGKTLVNLAICKNLQVSSPQSNFNRYAIGKSSRIKPNTTYTIVSWATKNSNHNPTSTNSVPFQIVFGGVTSDGDNWGCRFNPSVGDIKPYEVSKFTTPSNFRVNNEDLMILISEQNRGSNFNLSLLVLEGDYTQNPPSYFEGMKSVGDGVDEIVVSSFNSGKFTIENVEKDKFIDYKTGNTEFTSSWGASDFIEVQEGLPIIQSIRYSSPAGGIAFYDSSKRYISGVNANIKLGDFETTVPKGAKYMRCCDKVDEINVYFGSKNELNNICKSDKKKVLYYDTETQTWKKPVLREWDSVEKHTDGKYYYHKNSEEMLLNSIEDSWYKDATLSKCCRFYLRDSKFKSGTVICSKFNSIENYSLDEPHIYTSAGQLWLFIPKYELETENVEGLKKWLQVNNMTIVYPSGQEKVYECTPIDLQSFSGETNYQINSGVISPKSTLRCQKYIGNIIDILKDKVDNLEDSSAQNVFELMTHNHDGRYLNAIPKRLTPSDDLNNITTPGCYAVAEAKNSPYNYGRLLVLGWDTNQKWITQVFFSDMSNKVFTRCSTNETATTWTPWKRLVDESEVYTKVKVDELIQTLQIEITGVRTRGIQIANSLLSKI